MSFPKIFLIFLLVLIPIAAHAKDCVILLHGIARSPASLAPLTTTLQQAGYQAESFTYPDREKNLSDIITTINPTLTAYASQCSGAASTWSPIPWAASSRAHGSISTARPT